MSTGLMRSLSINVREIRLLMQLAMRFKESPRTGWNAKFPPGHRCITRVVKEPEHGSDHTWAMQFLFFLLMQYVSGVDKLRTMAMIIGHDLVETLSGDPVSAVTELPEKQAEIRKQKKERETWAIDKICEICPTIGALIRELLAEYDARLTAEAKLAHQLNKLEPCFQAVRYYHRGEQVDPLEFFRDAGPHIYEPALVEIFEDLQDNWKSEDFWGSIQIPWEQ